MSNNITPFALKDTPALIESLLPVQKLSAEAYKEQMANAGKTLTVLSSYWKGRKPLILNKACILGCLLPASADSARDLKIFEMLMAMDDESFVVRWNRPFKPKEVLEKISLSSISDYFDVDPKGVLPEYSPVDWLKPEYTEVEVRWREDITELERRRLEAQLLPKVSYRERVALGRRPEMVVDRVHAHIWDTVNSHIGTNAHSMTELVEQLGIMRFGHRPSLADTFCGSGQIPFEAARLGCEVYASDINPVASMLTWGALNVLGSTPNHQTEMEKQRGGIVANVLAKIDTLGAETDGNGWRAKTYLYCLEVRCPQSGWLVPLLPSRILSYGKKAIVDLVPDLRSRRYDIVVRSNVTPAEMASAKIGTIRSDGRGQDPYLTHTLDGVEYRTKISTLRGDYRKPDGSIGNRLRPWGRSDFKPHCDDIFQERLFAIHWMRPKKSGKKFDYEFRSVGDSDLKREALVEEYIAKHLSEWQDKGWIPDMRIETGDKTGEPIRTRGWTHWHHIFPPRHLLILGLLKRYSCQGETLLMLAKVLDYTSKLCRWAPSSAGSSRPGEGKKTGGASDNPSNVFYNQALNTLYNYGCRASFPLLQMYRSHLPSIGLLYPRIASCGLASQVSKKYDIFITDPPYGDAIKYEEILEFFIAWLHKNPPPEFANWVWDSRRSLAITGEGEDFRRGMVAAYKRMTECMSDNGIQIIMFTHQSGAIWADMANIVWASDLKVMAAWYVATETDSALRQGSYVKGTVLLVCRRREGAHKTTRDDLAWEIQEEVEAQVQSLIGLNQEAKGLYRDENVFEDADIQIAGYAAAMRVLTRYTTIDGRDMASEALRPRVKGETTFVDGLIAFAVDTANQSLVPLGIARGYWDRLSGAERFYLKLLDLEARGIKTLDNYQNFAKAFKVRDFHVLMGDQRANHARLKSAVEFSRAEMSEGSEMHVSVLRAVLYAVMELVKNTDGAEVLAHLMLNIPNYYGDMTQREIAIELADYLARQLETLRPEEASAARVLRELIKNQRLG